MGGNHKLRNFNKPDANGHPYGRIGSDKTDGMALFTGGVLPRSDLQASPSPLPSR
jgi:hypothetical protein